MPIQRRVPKRGFTNIFRREFQIVNVSQLERIPDGMEITPDTLYDYGLIRKRNKPVKLLGNGEIDRAVTVRVDKCSQKARELVVTEVAEVQATPLESTEAQIESALMPAEGH